MENAINLTPIVEAVITLIGILITTFLVPYLKNKISAQNLDKATILVRSLVLAAEQIYSGPGRGKEKLQYVEDVLRERGYNVDMNNATDKMRVLVESIVLELQKK